MECLTPLLPRRSWSLQRVSPSVEAKFDITGSQVMQAATLGAQPSKPLSLKHGLSMEQSAHSLLLQLLLRATAGCRLRRLLRPTSLWTSVEEVPMGQSGEDLESFRGGGGVAAAASSMHGSPQPPLRCHPAADGWAGLCCLRSPTRPVCCPAGWPDYAQHTQCLCQDGLGGRPVPVHRQFISAYTTVLLVHLHEERKRRLVSHSYTGMAG